MHLTESRGLVGSRRGFRRGGHGFDLHDEALLVRSPSGRPASCPRGESSRSRSGSSISRRPCSTRRSAYVTTPKGDLFYDLVADPLATRDHLGKNPAGVNAARAVLEAAHRACDEPGWLINREEIERKLRSLGYGHSARISQIAASSDDVGA